MGKVLIILALVFSVGCQEEYRLRNIRCQQPCYTGPPNTEDVGICKSGTPVCENESMIGCEGEVLPEDEYCDLIDNDCNGTIDDSVWDEDVNTRCGSSVGECYTGINICTGGEIECLGAKDASEETCNSLDDDCNGFIDDMELLGYCYEGDPEDLYHGECHAGILICVDGIEICDQQQLPTEEVCDSLDNDCDGFIDEDLDEEDEVDIVFILDRSGSMGSYFSSVANASQLFAASFTGVPEFQFALVGIPHDPGTSEVEILLDFTDASTFVSTLATMSTVGGSLEASYDAPYIVSNGDLGLSWRGGDTRKYIVLFTDERAQSYISPILTEADVAAELVAEDITFYGFISSSFYSQFDDIADDTGGAIYNLGSSADMEDDLAKIFDDECW